MLRSGILLLIAFGPAAFAQDSFEWDLPQPFPRPAVPADNPMAAATVELGRHLFYDRRMSANGKQSRGDLPQAGTRIYRRTGEGGRNDGRIASAQQHEPIDDTQIHAMRGCNLHHLEREL